MNPEIKNLLVNRKIAKRHTDRRVEKTVERIETQPQADLYCEGVVQDKRLMSAHPVHDAGALNRVLALAACGLLMLAAVAGVLVWIWPELQAPETAPLGVLAAAAVCVASTALALTLLWRGWRLRWQADLPELTVKDVEQAHALRAVVCEQHKLPPAGWEQSTVAWARGIECAGFAYLAMLGLGALPPNVAISVGLALGITITGAVSMLGRMHAQRLVIAEGLKMYRARKQLANELEQVGDPRAPKYLLEADTMREALKPANRGQFAAPSKLSVGALWVVVGTMTALALALRVLFGAAVGAKAFIGAGILAVASALIFWASFRVSERLCSMAGDPGQRAMLIAARFPTTEAFVRALQQHQRQVEQLFRRVMLVASRVHHDKLSAQDLERPRLPLRFSLDPAAPPVRPPGPWAPTHLPHVAPHNPGGPDHVAH